MPDTLTDNLELIKPQEGASRDTWGAKNNGNFDILDSIFEDSGNGLEVGLHIGTSQTLRLAGHLIVPTGAPGIGNAALADNTIHADKMNFSTSYKVLGHTTGGGGVGMEMSCSAQSFDFLATTSPAAARAVIGAAASDAIISPDNVLFSATYKVLGFTTGGGGAGQELPCTSQSFDFLAAASPAAARAVIGAAGTAAPAGSMVGFQNQMFHAHAQTNNVLAAVNTIPTSGDGAQFMATSYDPKATGNILRIDIVFCYEIPATGGGANGAVASAALFLDAGGAAVAAASQGTDKGTNQGTINFTHVMVAPSTAIIAFKVRAGPDAGGFTLHMNNDFNGVQSSSITITEIQV